MTHEQQTISLEDRRLGIGGSDIAAIAGLSPYKTPLQVYLDKVEGSPSIDNEPMRWGRALEDVIAQRYAEETGSLVEPGCMLVHPERPWQRGNVDRYARSQVERILLEIKTAGFRQAHRWGESGTDEIPEDYLAQTHWYLPLAPDCTHAEIPVLIGGNDYRVYRVERNPELEGALLELAERFWLDHVEKKVPPAVDGSESAREWLAKRYPRETAPLLKSTPAVEAIAKDLRDARRRLEQAETDKAFAENRLKELIGNAAGVEGDGWRVTWKARKGSAKTDWQAIASELNPGAELIAKHTKQTNGARVFLAKFSEEG